MKRRFLEEGEEMELFRNGIIAITSPWVTAQNPTNSQIESFDGTVFLQRFHRILRTCGGKAARRRGHRADESLVEADGEDEELAEHKSSCMR